MPSITINEQTYDFDQGQTILQIALDHDLPIPHYCYHPELSIPANCRICLAEVWAPNPRNEGKLESMGKLLPTCQTHAQDGQVVYTESPKAIANQKAVMEYLLINHPVDCPVCDQAGECYLQDYAYQYGRGQSRFTEDKIKQPKKDLGPHVLLYADRCIMCTRCVRFTREVTGTGELLVQGRGGHEEIDVFPGMALDNELSANVIDICPVGALLDKDFLFQQRVWFLKRTASIDGLTCSGDNISVEHNDGAVYRIKPRPNPFHKQWWITDEVRYGWKFVHAEERLRVPAIRGQDAFEMPEAGHAWEAAYHEANALMRASKSMLVLVSPMLSCEDAWLLAQYTSSLDAEVTFALGPVPRHGEDKTFPSGYTSYAEKAPNARGVRRVLASFKNKTIEYKSLLAHMASCPSIDLVFATGNYPSTWATEQLITGIGQERKLILLDTLESQLSRRADVLLPTTTWVEKSGTFEDVHGRLQAFERAIEPIDYCKSEAQIAIDLLADLSGESLGYFNPANVRERMAKLSGLEMFINDVSLPVLDTSLDSDMQLIEL
jgi:NADH-quinone oxidoreductase subunit G